MAENPSKPIFITGASMGIGRTLAEVVLEAGRRVVGTVRGEATQ